MKKSYKTLLLAGLVSTSLQAVANAQNEAGSEQIQTNKKNYFIEVDGYRKLITDDETINALDLEAVKVKLMDPEDGEGWTLEQADTYGEKYRAFLYLSKKYPERKIIPSVEVDAVWHAHILDTYKYHDDCEKIFGRYFHHFPFFGMRNEDDKADLEASFKETLDIYREEFPSQISKKLISIQALCIGEKPGRCAMKEESVKSALCIGEKGTRCLPTQQAVKSALCIGEKGTRCAVVQESVDRSKMKGDNESREVFQNRIRPTIDRSTGKMKYEE